MATVKQLEAELRSLKELLAAHQIVPSLELAADEDRLDHVHHGSAQHAAFLGLEEVDPEFVGRLTFPSPRIGPTFDLLDEVAPFMNTADPRQMAQLTLRQKVNALETKPEVPDSAPPIWVPVTPPM